MGGVPNRTSYELHLPAEMSTDLQTAGQRFESARRLTLLKRAPQAVFGKGIGNFPDVIGRA
jgi:hypothetical protein